MAEANPRYRHLTQEELSVDAQAVLSRISAALKSKWRGDTITDADASAPAVRALFDELMLHYQVPARKYTFVRLKSNETWRCEHPVFLFPLMIEPHIHPAVSGTSLDINKVIYIAKDVDITGRLEALLVMQAEAGITANT